MTTPITGNTTATMEWVQGPAGWLALAAAPTFVAMAWISIGDASVLCSGSGMLPMDGMASMYLLMSLFHLPPWLKLTSRHGATEHLHHNRTEGD